MKRNLKNGLSCIICFALLLSSSVFAAIIVVTSQPGQVGCDLIEAIKSANTNTAIGDCAAGSAGQDTITFALSISQYQFNAFDNTSAASGGTATPLITSDIEIAGVRTQPMIVQRTGTEFFRFFSVTEGHLTLRNLSLRNGFLSAYDGGAIRVSAGAKLTLSNVELKANSAVLGGAIMIDASGVAASPEVIIERSLFQGNMASGSGGGIAQAFDSTLIVTDSTFSANTGASGGGAIALTGAPGAQLFLYNNTIVGNISSSGGGGLRVFFGGSDPNNDNSIVLRNNIISGNQGAEDPREIKFQNEITGSQIDFSNNIIGTRNFTLSQTINSLTVSNITNQFLTSDSSNPRSLSEIAGPLADNGGTTMTHALVPSSPAIDAGTPGIFDGPPTFIFNPGCRGTKVNAVFTFPAYRADQRKVVRPLGAECDIGAYEFEPAADICIPIKASNGNIAVLCL